jgi:hypothetical protein
MHILTFTPKLGPNYEKYKFRGHKLVEFVSNVYFCSVMKFRIFLAGPLRLFCRHVEKMITILYRNQISDKKFAMSGLKPIWLSALWA